MPKRQFPYAAGGGGNWSVGSSSLTATGQSELLKSLGRQLQTNYQKILKEPAPNHIRELLERLESSRIHEGDEHR